jgi:hypothetical protein
MEEAPLSQTARAQITKLLVMLDNEETPFPQNPFLFPYQKLCVDNYPLTGARIERDFPLHLPSPSKVYLLPASRRLSITQGNHRWQSMESLSADARKSSRSSRRVRRAILLCVWHPGHVK